MDKTNIILRLKEIKHDLAKINYYDYVSYVHNDYIYTRHAEFMCNTLNEAIEKKKLMLEGKIKQENQYIAISMPPRHGKSMNITETLPSYYLGQFPNHRIIECSYNTTFATKFGKKNRQKVEEFGKDLFNIEISRESSSSTDWDIEGHKGGMISRGILAGVTGEGADLMIIDDPVKNREEANSEVYRDKLWEEWIDTLSTRLHPCAIVVIILTRWHEDDLIGRLLNREYGEPLPWKVINLSLEAEINDVMGRSIGEPLWKERYGYDFIKQRKMYPQSFNSLYQGRPTAQEGNMLKREWWQYYDVLPQMIEEIISVDATFKDNEDNDYVSIQVWGKRGADMYLIDRVKARMNFPTTLTAIRNICNKYPRAVLKLVEDKANGPAIISMLSHEIGGIVPVTPEGGKVARVNAVSPYIEAGNVYLPRNKEWIHDFVEECASFPNGAHDDDVDAMSQALNRFIYFNAKVPQAQRPQEHYAFRSEETTGGGYIQW